MKKDTYYFSHDANAHKDAKIIFLIKDCGWEGYGIFWYLIETMREEKDFKLSLCDCNALAYDCRLSYANLKKIIDKCFDLKLFNKNETYFWSPSLIRRMEMKSNSAKIGANIRWNKDKEMQTHTNAYERMRTDANGCLKVKESKVKKSKINIDTEVSPDITKWDYDVALSKWLNGKDRAFFLIARMFKAKGLVFESYEQMQIAKQQHLKAANKLKEFSDEQISAAFAKIKENKLISEEEWRLETILKYITK